MGKRLAKLLLIIVALSLVIAIFMDYLIVHNSSESMKTEVNAKLVSTADTNANKMNTQLTHMVGLTDALQAYVENEFNMNDYENSPDSYINKEIELEYNFMESCLNTSTNAHSLYVVYDDSLTSVPKEAWVALRNGKIERIYKDIKSRPTEQDNMDDKNMAYYFNAAREGSSVWTGLYHDNDINENVFSYTRPVFKKDKLIAVVGADIVADDILTLLDSMNTYASGSAILLDSDFDYISSSKTLKTKHRNYIISKFTDKSSTINSKNTGIINYEYNGVKYIAAYSHLNNDWLLATVQQQQDAYSPINNISNIMKGIGALLAVLVMLALGAYTAPFIKKERVLEESNEQKDIMIAYQSRQAKIGEMIGNISHQWKQPLNDINLIAEDTLDSYRFDELDESSLEKSVRRVEEITGQMSQTISDFSTFLKPSESGIEYFNMAQCVQSALNLLESSLKHNHIEIQMNQTGLSWVCGYSNEIIHVIFNVLHNARDSILESGKQERIIRIDIEGSGVDGEYTVLRIIDSGTGLSDGSGDKIFDAYFTTKEKNKGTGLGLYISKRIVEEHMGGSIALRNAEAGDYDFDAGAVCEIKIPNTLPEDFEDKQN